MVKVLFVCHGSICRSPMAEFIMKDMIRERGLDSWIEASSAATSTEELGNPVYPPARRKLAEHGIRCDGHYARRLRADDYKKYDYLIGMDRYNIRNILRLTGSDPEGKVRKLTEFAGMSGDIDDPWYTGDFETVYHQIVKGCEGLITELTRRKGEKDHPGKKKRV